jgi:1-acyl-sn-glycerol-3-phosphate acyltransferase
MITDILYRCPICGGFDWLKNSRCISCNAQVEILSRSEVSINAQTHSIAHWYSKILTFNLPEPDEGVIMKSGKVLLSRECQKGIYKGFSGVVANHYARELADEGYLALKDAGIFFSGSKESILIPYDKVTSITIESNTIILISKDHGVLFFDFLEESGKMWEDSIRKALVTYHMPKKITEFYPHLRLESDLRENPGKTRGHKKLYVPVSRWFKCDYSPVFAFIRRLAKPIMKILFSVDISGIHNIPKCGSAVLLSNHTSFLDSIILGVFPKRYIWFMAKNSEYRGPFFSWALKRARAFPVRRYTNDVQAIRNAIRIVQQGHILGIFPEGERTWDNTLLPFKYGTIRLVLALGRPVIPVGISGAYELMPRWTSSIKRVPVKIQIGPPILFDHIPIPQQTRKDIEMASLKLGKEIARLSGGWQ